MRAKMLARLLSAAMIVSPLALVSAAAPAEAQGRVQIGFNFFYDNLAPYGVWYHHPRWGDAWHPTDVGRDFRPYTNGSWAYTNEYGWVWQSDYEWGDIAFHYGRWVYDPVDGWLWIPGYVWAPAWVVWREGDGYIGWFPMPPDDAFLNGTEVYNTSWTWNRGFGYDDWYGPQFVASTLPSFWVFVDERHFADRDFRRYEAPRNEFPRLIRQTRNVTNYTTVNNYIVNRSVDVNRISQRAGRRIAPLPVQDVVKQAPVTQVDAGRQIQIRERRQHGGNPSAPARARAQRLPPQAANARQGANQAQGQAAQRGQQQNAQQGQAQGRPGFQGRRGQFDQQAPQQQAEQRQTQDQQRQRQQAERQQAQQQQAEQRQTQDQQRQRQQTNRQQAQQQQAEQRQAQDQQRQRQQAERQQAQQQPAEQRQAQDQQRQQQQTNRQQQQAQRQADNEQANNPKRNRDRNRRNDQQQ